MEQSDKNKGLRSSVLLMLALALFLVAFIFYMVGSNQKFFDAKYTLYLFLDRAEALNPGAFVTISGLKVGVVGDMKFTRRNHHQGILVELKVDKNYAEQITASSRASVKTMGVLGDKYVDISLGKLSEPPLQPGDFVRSEPSVDMGALFADAASSVSELNGLLANLQQLSAQMIRGQGAVGKLLSDERMAADMHNIVRHVSNMSSDLERGKGNAGKFLQDSLLYQSLLNTSKQLDAITGRIDDGQGTIGKLVADSTFYPKLLAIAVQSDSLLNKLQGEGTFGELLNDKKLYKELLQLTRELSELTKDIKENPGKYGSFSIF